MTRVTLKQLSQIISPRSKATILMELFLNPTKKFSTRELARITGLNIHTVVRSLEKLEQIKLIQITRIDGRKNRIILNQDHPLFNPLLTMFHTSSAVGQFLIRQVHSQKNILICLLTYYYLLQKPKKQFNFDVLFVIENKTIMPFIAQTMQEAETIAGKQLVYTILTKAEFQTRKDSLDPFVWDVLSHVFVPLKGSIRQILGISKILQQEQQDS